MKVSTTSHKWLGGLAIVLILSGWQLAAAFIQLPLILPMPREALNQAISLIGTIDFWHHLGASLTRGIWGFGWALFFGLAVGTCCGRSKAVGAFFRPLIILFRSTPVMSVIILALIWFKSDTVPVFVVFLMAFPIIVQNIIAGIREVDHDLLEVVASYRVTKWRRFIYLYLPSVAPFLAAGISSGLGITWKVLIAAEVLSYPAWGIGAQMDTARTYLQTDKVFAWTLVVIALGLVFDYFLDMLLKKPFVAWKETTYERSRL
jgi:NitT/TauT family transport system permease protein